MRDENNEERGLDNIFSPRSIAVVGATENTFKAGYNLLKSFINIGFKGDLYAVNPKVDKVFNCNAYSTISDIPGEVDHVVVTVPSKNLPSIIQQCVNKSVKSVVIFTSGFSEIGTKEGRALEDRIVRLAQKSKLRIIGPNCMGIYCPSSGLSFRMDLPKKSGSTALISQSGGMAITSILSASEHNIFFSKVVSYGNECDLGSVELIKYFSEDEQTEIILVYIEGTKNGEELFFALKNACSVKPVILLKGGISEAGTRAVISHTGALSGMATTWSSAVYQSGGIQVYSIEELIDTTLAFKSIKSLCGKSLGIVTISGGVGVNLTDLAVMMEFDVPEFNEKIKADLEKLLNIPGTAVKNPIDMAATFFNTKNFSKVFNLLDNDDSLDIIMMHFSLEYIIRFREIMPGLDEVFVNDISEGLVRLKKPFFLVIPYTIKDDIRSEFEKKFIGRNIPVFATIERALKSISHCISYYRRRD